MSATSQPIPPERFAAALESLSLSSLHAKAAELRNSLLHLQLSNAQLQGFADEGDADCAEALKENEAVVGRLRERLDILKAEVERRGSRWIEWDEEEAVNGSREGNNCHDVESMDVNGDVTDEISDHVHTGRISERRGPGGTLSDEELFRQMREQMDDDENEAGGLHL